MTPTKEIPHAKQYYMDGMLIAKIKSQYSNEIPS